MTSTRQKMIVLLLLCALPGPLLAQTPASVQREEMKKLDWLVGQWKGEGWVEVGPGQRRTSTVTETVQSKLDGSVLLVEGIGKAKLPGRDEEVIVHHALGTLAYDEPAKLYRMRAYRAGHYVDAEAKLTEGGLEWGFPDPRGGRVRFIIKLDEKGRWSETGEVSQDGKTWRKFMEMTLERVK